MLRLVLIGKNPLQIHNTKTQKLILSAGGFCHKNPNVALIIQPAT
jgi:hypothetical protein